MNSTAPWQNGEWFDDWFAIEAIDQQTVAIAEPRYWQFPVSYLIWGREGALLLESGSGRRNIRPVVEALTDLPLTVTCSHVHFDHVGNHARFERVAMFDHPTLRQRVMAGRFTPSLKQHLKLGRPSFRVAEWWVAGEIIDLGARRIQVLHVPGHTPESIALLDRERGQLFLGDLLYNYELYVVDLDQYLCSTQVLLQQTNGSEQLYGAHGVPHMPYSRLETLNQLVQEVQRGDVKPRLSLQSMVPQRQVEAGEIELRIPWFGIQGLLVPFLAGGLITILLALVVGALGSWLLSLPVLVTGAVLVALAYRRM
jgi:glyoxylase-like metal-dependent hydrolase (beta-lactamase superfamily II)